MHINIRDIKCVSYELIRKKYHICNHFRTLERHTDTPKHFRHLVWARDVTVRVREALKPSFIDLAGSGISQQ